MLIRGGKLLCKLFKEHMMIKNRHMKNIGLVLLGLAILTGCNDSKESETTESSKQEIKVDKTASAENFKNVINKLLAKDCILIRTEGFPVEIEAPVKSRLSFDQDNINIYKELEKSKLVKSDGKTIKKVGHSKTEISLTKYILTEKGKKYYRARGKYDSGFCIATQEVDEITNYTAPKYFMGMTVSTVNYTLKTKEEPFVKDINKSIFKDRMNFDYQKSDTEKLVLTEMKGWITMQEFRKR